MRVPKEIVCLNLDSRVDEILKYGKSLRENKQDVGLNYFFLAFTSGEKFNVNSNQDFRIGSPQDNSEMSVYLNGSGDIEIFKFGQLLEKLISKGIIELKQQATGSAADINEVSEKLREKYVDNIDGNHNQMHIHCGGKTYYISPMGHYLEGNLTANLLERRPQLAPVLGVKETLSLKIKGKEYKFKEKSIPADFDFREFSEMMRLYKLAHDTQEIIRSTRKYRGIRAVGIKHTPKIISYDDGKPAREIVPDLIDKRPVAGSALYRILHDGEMFRMDDLIEKRHGELFPKYAAFFRKFLEEVERVTNG